MAAQGYEVVPDVLYQGLGGEAVLLNLNDDHYYGLDDVGTRMWQLLQEHGDVDAVVELLLAEFDVEEAELRRDLSLLIGQLEEAGLIRRR